MLSRYVRPDVARTTSLVAYKAGADVLGKLVTLVITVLGARLLTPGEFGVLMLALTTGWLLGVASDAGLPLFLSRAVARDGVGSPVFAPVIRLRAALAAGAVVAGLLVALWITPFQWVFAFFLIVVAQIVATLIETVSHLFRGAGRSEIESTVLLGHRSAVGVASVAVFLWWPSLMAIAVVFIVSTSCALAASLLIATRLRRQTTTKSTLAAVPIALTDFAPIGLGVLLSALYFRCDVFFVEYWHGLETVGTYNAAFRLVEALRVFPAAMLAVQFPLLCRATDLRPLRALTLVLTAAGMALAMALFAAAPLVLDVLYGDRFIAAAPALRVLALALPLFFLNYALTHQVIGWDGQRAYLVITAAALVANVAGNFILIPSQGMVGAAVSTLATELVVTGGCVMVLIARRASLPLLPRPEVP
jgi:O-antigen/teichoic acid export membrane protein